ncbi:hypothetical protein GCE86_19685 [Micromonospora terminaliae]|uniref:Uncharacterized protein n=1 Tax=Micromonospora terminaliae TaxID=1914461 RepID=A0AAJ2ZG39_9ACTN|nr:hypothetical protein [Micromonospora terminaliae]NES28946.1 hypothetical protein [Micromonospora terminaliae]QGL49035.1 hypothetical protein GCE86_19685 [Micromonospora terminaliae]
MNRATIFQAAVAVILAGLFLMLAGSQPPLPRPGPVRSYRPATEAEKRQREVEQLREELERYSREMDRKASPTPSAAR